jgi:hypothetical protein
MRVVLILFVVALCCLSCNNKQDIPQGLIGKWKIFYTKMNGKDISKSADPTNENGLEFQADGNYISFGNPRHQDKGIYEVNKDNLLLKSKTNSGTTSTKMLLKQDTLQLEISVDSTSTLFMNLYRMD